MSSTRNIFLYMVMAAGLSAGFGAGCRDDAPSPSGKNGKAGNAGTSRPRVDIDKNASWPMARGGPTLRGVADGEIADKLSLAWRFKTGDAVFGSPSIGGGRVYIGSDDTHLYCLDAATGEKVWAYKTGADIQATPLLIGGRVVVGSGDGFIHCLDADGKLVWRHETGSTVYGGASFVRSPDGTATWVLACSYDALLYCLDLATGKVVWTYESDDQINGAPALLAGRVMFGGCDGFLHVVSAADGRKLQAIDVESYVPASPAVAGNSAYLGHADGQFFRVNLEAGTIAWRFGEEDDAFFSSAALTRDRVVVGSQSGRLHCLDRYTGRKVWSYRAGDMVNSSPVVCGGKVVVGADDGRLHIVRLSDGKGLWRYTLGQPVAGSPAVAGGLIVIGCTDGTVTAFGPKPVAKEE